MTMYLRTFKRLGAVCFMALLPIFFVLMPVSAVYSDPASIALISQKAFRNVFETGDMLFAAEHNVAYVTNPTDDPSTLFFYNLYDASGNLINSRGINYYEDNVISIYFSATQVTSLGLTWGAVYSGKIIANPSKVVTLTEGTNMVTKAFDATDWIDGTITTTPALLYSYCYDVMEQMKTSLALLTPPVVITQLTNDGDVLNYLGATYFSNGIPGLVNIIPQLYQVASGDINSPAYIATGALQVNQTVTNELGPTAANGIKQLGIWLGISSNMAGGLLLMVIVIVIMVTLFKSGGSTTTAMVLAVPILLIGAWSGLMPIALLYTIAILVASYMVYSIWLRGI